MQIKFNATPEDKILIRKIVDRYYEMSGSFDHPRIDLIMDITATHLNGTPLHLQAWLEADDFNFIHDIVGIRDHINRKTGKLNNHFFPRFAK